MCCCVDHRPATYESPSGPPYIDSVGALLPLLEPFNLRPPALSRDAGVNLVESTRLVKALRRSGPCLVDLTPNTIIVKELREVFNHLITKVGTLTTLQPKLWYALPLSYPASK